MGSVAQNKLNAKTKIKLFVDVKPLLKQDGRRVDIDKESEKILNLYPK